MLLRERHNQLAMRVDQIVRKHQQAAAGRSGECVERTLGQWYVPPVPVIF
jgi:hypothetical protein